MRILLKDLQPGQKYAIQLRAVGDTAVSDWSQKFTFTAIKDGKKPGIPENITWAVVGSGFSASWDAVTETVAGTPAFVIRYDVELVAGPGNTKRVKSVPQTQDGEKVWFHLSKEDVVALWGTLYPEVKMRVRAVDGNGLTSDWSAQFTANNEAPNAPTNGNAVSIIDGIQVSWDAPVDDDLVSYEIYVSTDPDFEPGFLNLVGTVAADTTQFLYVTSTYAPHYFKVRAVDEYGLKGEFLDIVSDGPRSPFQPDDTSPTVPSLSAPTLVRDSQGRAAAQLSWTFDANSEQNSDLQGFAVRWRKVGDTIYSLEIADKDSRAISISLPAPFADYEFAISAFDWAANYSEYSGTVTLTGSIPGPPPVLASVTANPGLDSLQIIWSESSASDVRFGGYYEVEISPNSDFTGSTMYRTSNLTITVSGLASNTTYYFRARAVDTTDQRGPWVQNSISTTLFPTPDPSDSFTPSLSPTPSVTGGLGSLFVAWTPVTTNSNGGPQNEAVVYEVHLSATSAFTPDSTTKVGEVTGGTSLAIRNLPGSTTPLSYGTTYFVKTIAKDSDGPAAASGQASGSTLKINHDDIVTGSIATDLFTANTINGSIITAGTLSATKITTGDLESAIITLKTGGQIKSSDYVSGTSGFSLSTAGLEIVDGIVSAKTLKGGTISGTTITVGVGGALVVDSTAVIRSNVYSPGSTGWRLSSSGLEINDANSSVKADAIKAGQIGAQTITIASGGDIRSSNYVPGSSGWKLGGIGNSSGLEINQGTVSASTITTGQLKSSQPARDVNGNSLGAGTYSWFIDMQGDAQFGNALILGRLTVGSSTYATTSGVQSYNFAPGSAGWQIKGDGSVEFNSATLRGTFTTSTGTNKTQIDPTNGYLAQFYNGPVLYTISMAPATWATSGSGWDVGPEITLNTNSAVAGRIRVVEGGGMLIRSNGTGNPLELHLDQGGFGGQKGFRFNNGPIFVGSIYNLFVNNVSGNGSSITFASDAGDNLLLQGVGRVAWHNSAVNTSLSWGVDGSSVGILKVIAGNNTTYRRIYASEFFVPSDIRDKTNITPAASNLSSVKKMPVYDYDTIHGAATKEETGGKGAATRRRRGVIAQDVAAAVPGGTTTDENGLVLVDMYSLVSTALGAIQELSAEVAALKSRLGS